MRTTAETIRRFKRLARLIERTAADAEPNLLLSSEPFEAERLAEDAKNICYALRDSIKMLRMDEIRFKQTMNADGTGGVQ